MTDRSAAALPRPAPGGRPATSDCADDDLRSRIAAGDRAALERLIEQHRPRVTGLAYRLLGWPDEVEDVVQDVFVSALTNLGRFRGDCALSTWLTTITVNACRSRRRRLRSWATRWLGLGDTDATVGSAPPGSGGSGPTITKIETFDHVRQAVQALPVKYREVVVLRYLEQMPVPEIGRVLGLTRDTVETRLSRARRRLRDRLSGFVEASQE
ncbi:MAG: RNA polymerase sigma factor [bacterium]|nr:RNA polymerase sigma factor [bacterium]